MSWILATLLAMHIGPVSSETPNRQPQLASGYGIVALTFAAGSAIYFAASSDDGQTFGTPLKVTDTKLLAAGRHRGPRVQILKDAIVITAVAGEKAGGEHSHGLPADGDLLTWRSTDQGKTWTQAGTINDVPGSAREGLHAMASDAKGNLFVAWLDLRGMGTKLYGSKSSDGGRTWATNVEIYSSPDGSICECCDPSIAIGSDGHIAVMWRNSVNGSRDLYIAHATSNFSFGEAAKVGQGTWKLNACPMDGGGIAFYKGTLTSAWRRDGEVFIDTPGKAEQKIAVGKDVAITAGAKGIYVGFTNGKAIQVQEPGAAQLLELTANGSFVNLAALPSGAVIAAWEENGAIYTQRRGR